MLLVSKELISEFSRLSAFVINQVQRQFINFLDQKSRSVLGRKKCAFYVPVAALMTMSGLVSHTKNVKNNPAVNEEVSFEILSLKPKAVFIF